MSIPVVAETKEPDSIIWFKCCFQPRYDSKRKVLSLRLNSAVDPHSFKSVGSSFHTRSVTTDNARSPTFT